MDEETNAKSDSYGKKPAAYYLEMIESALATDEMREWDEACKAIRKKYRYADSKKVKTRRYQMLWSNMEVLKPVVMAKPPLPVVQRRYRDKDPVGREACELLERACRFQVECNDYYSRLEQVRDDFLLYGRGVARVYYEPVYTSVEDDDDVDGLDEASMRGPDAVAQEEMQEATEAGTPQQVLDFENVKLRFVQRVDFVHEAARTWDEVSWVAFRAYLSKDELVERFGEELAAKIPLESVETAENERMNSDTQKTKPTDKAMIWEFWDKEAQQVCWIAKGYPEVLESGPPYLKLTGFFPCPKPAFGTLSTDSLAPRPDYIYYQDQAEEIDALTARIGALQQALKLVGFYPAGPHGEGAPEIEKAVSPVVENKMIAVKSWAVFTEGGKGGAPIVWLPVEQVVVVLKSCIELRKQLIEDIYQIIGISDIMRGDGDKDETATAQNIKAQFGSTRIRERQQELARFSRDVTRMLGEIICSTFEPDTLLKMANMKIPTEQELFLAQQQQMLAMQAQQSQMMMPPAMPQAQMPPPAQPMPQEAMPQAPAI